MTDAVLSSAFDDHRPPRLDLINDCVHCGFCLSTCPTYVLWGEEADSPRGRIYLMETGLAGEPMTDSMVQHFDRCLGCMACVTACPSGVRYDRLIEDTRAQVERRHPRTRAERLLRGAIFRLFPYPRRLRLLRGPLRAYQASGVRRRLGPLLARTPTLATLESLAPRLRRPERLPERVPAVGPRRAVVGMLTGCVQRAFFPDVNAATARVLAAEGCDVVLPRAQGCCGALSVHTGRETEAQRFARTLINAFEDAGVDYLVVNAAGCGSSLKEYGDLLRDDPSYAERAAAPPRCATCPRCSSSSARWRPGTRCRCPWRTTMPATSRTRRACGPSRAGCSRTSPACRCARSPRPRSAAARPGCGTCSTPSRLRSSATARRATCWPPAPTSW